MQLLIENYFFPFPEITERFKFVASRMYLLLQICEATKAQHFKDGFASQVNKPPATI